jgi:BlaI family penicillinase repressor
MTEKENYTRIPKSEWEVLRVLWKRGACSVSQIQTTLAQNGNPCTLGAVRSFLNRLAARNVVRTRNDEPIMRFEAIYGENELLSRERNSFLEKYFDGTVSSLVAHYLQNEKVPVKEMERLRNLLDSYRKKSKKEKES